MKISDEVLEKMAQADTEATTETISSPKRYTGREIHIAGLQAAADVLLASLDEKQLRGLAAERGLELLSKENSDG